MQRLTSLVLSSQLYVKSSQKPSIRECCAVQAEKHEKQTNLSNQIFGCQIALQFSYQKCSQESVKRMHLIEHDLLRCRPRYTLEVLLKEDSCPEVLQTAR